jgi:hypothetical protein
MKSLLSLFIVLVLLFMAQNLTAQVSATVEVEEMLFCTAVEERVPVGADTVFSDTVGTVYCFTKLSSSEDSTSIAHVWYYNDQEMARVNLNVLAKSWRTWSSKTILQEWIGKWRVDAVSEAGEVLKSKAFEVK